MVSCNGAAFEAAAQPRPVQVAADEYDARAAIVRWPVIKPYRGVIHVLDPVNHRGALGFFGDRDYAFHPQQVCAAIIGERRQKKRERYAVQRLLSHDAKG